MLVLRATDKGEELVAKLRERRRGYMLKVLENLNMNDLAALTQGLTSLVQAAAAQEEKNVIPAQECHTRACGYLNQLNNSLH